MKPLNLLLIFGLLFPFTYLFAQRDTTKKESFDFFAKGNNSYNLIQTGYYSHINNFQDGQKLGCSNNTFFDMAGTHWFGHGFGAGLGIEESWSQNQSVYNDPLYRHWALSPHLSYGKMLNNRWGVFARAGINFERDRYIFKKSPAYTHELNLFGYDGTIALPYRFSGYTSLTASLGYEYSRRDVDNYRAYIFRANIRFEDYLSCHQIKCDISTGFKMSSNKYKRGRGFIDYDTRASLYAGHTMLDVDRGPQMPLKEKVNGLDITLHGSYYIVEHFALGGRLSFEHAHAHSYDHKNSDTQFEFRPEATFNMPVNNGWRNLFIKGGASFATGRYNSKSSVITTISKSISTAYNIGLGYYAFFAKETALKICTYYESTTVKDKDSDEKFKYRGFKAEVGISHSF